MSERVLVVGGTGLVGNALVRAWSARGTQVTATGFPGRVSGSFAPLDIQNEPDVRRLLNEARPTVVAVPAANSHVDYCELHPDLARPINVVGTLSVARVCRDLGARMIFYSSDYVFDGVKGNYTEEDAPRPINEYGRQKADAERGVLAFSPRNLVVRSSGVYGWQRETKNLVLQILARLGAGEPMSVADDLRYNPTYAENLAEITVALIAAQAAGIFHVVGAEEAARHEFAASVARAFGLDVSLIRPIHARALSSTPRPPRTNLLTDKVGATVSVEPVGVEEGLRRMIAMEPQWREYAKNLPGFPAKSSPPRVL